ncbi:MAG: hypothetical protein R3D27_10935 [Hyphomicrobiaceae bacterium]
MPLAARAFLAIWHDFDTAQEAEWHRWHTVEHMPERVNVPGFLAGRRYMSDTVERHRCFTMYEGVDISVFNSPAYLERLNNPTPWTRQVSTAFRDFMRGACKVVATAGGDANCPQIAGSVMTVRLTGVMTPGVEPRAVALAEALAKRPTIVGVHVAVCERAVTNVETTERKARSGTAESPLDGVVVIESYDRKALAAAEGDIRAAIAAAGLGMSPEETGIYDLVLYVREPA